MKKYLVIISIGLFAFTTTPLPRGWVQVEKTKINKEKIEVYFFDYMSKLEEIQPDYSAYKGSAFTDLLQKVQFQFPAYVAKRELDKQDSVVYFILRPNEKKSEQPYFFDLEIVKIAKEFPLESLEARDNYKENIVRTIDSNRVRGALVMEYNRIIQSHPNKRKLIGGGIQIADSIYTRVIPYSEIKNSFYKLIEANL